MINKIIPSLKLLTQKSAFVGTSARVLLKSSLWKPCRLSLSTMASGSIKRRVEDITKSEEDQRLYRGLELNNGMKILLISDSTTDKSSAAMDVNIGHMSNPVELPGLAHFCEHMLFLGTEKYPEENEYNKFLNEHGGSSNAFTSEEHTNYYFDVSPDNLPGALDRFSQFFYQPLFTASATDREVNAVNSENDKNLQNDSWRLFQLEKATCDLSHPYSRFGTGNKATLDTIPKDKGIDVRDELLKFHSQFYSSNLMGLAVLGKESLDELTELVVPLFTSVENKNLGVPIWENHPCGPEEVGLQATVVPVKDLRNLNVNWPIPDLHPHYKSNPGHYLGHLIGHEGAGSLLSELKNRGWVNTLVGGQKQGANGFMFFIVNVDLTEEGIEHTDDIITLIFQYLNMLKKEGPQEWVFKECQDLSAMGFRFKDKERPRNYTCSCAGLIHDFPMEEVLNGAYLMSEYKPDIVKMVLDKLVPENIRVAVIGQKFADQTDQKEEWYGTDYSIQKIPKDKLEAWKNAGFHDNLKLPARNEFIPTNFQLVARDEEVVRDTSMMRLWFKQDDKYLLPKACMNIEFTSPYAYMDPLCTNLTYMFVSLFRDALNEYAYEAELAGLHYDLHSTIYGLTLNLRGYNDKQHVLLQKIMDKMTSFNIDSQRFEILKEAYIRGLKNFKAEQPHQHAIYYTTVLTAEQLWTKEELLDATEEMTVEKLEQFIPQLLSRLYLELLIYGNVTKEKANEMADIVEKTLEVKTKTKPLMTSQQRRFREVQMPDGCCYVYKKTNEIHKSSSLEVYYQCNMQATHSNMLLELFCQIIGEPCFDILRTQEQLGYIVLAGVRRSNGVQGLRVIVQSDKTPEYVESRIEAFLHKMESHISEMTDKVFENHVGALATRRLEKPKRLSAQNVKYWSEIISQQYNFDRDDMEVAHLKTVKKEDILSFYKELIAHDAPLRHKLSVHVTSIVESQEQEQAPLPPPEVSSGAGDGKVDGLVCPAGLAEAVEITDVSQFKRCLGLFPLPKPYMNVAAAKSKL